MKYTQAFQVASVAIRDLQKSGWKFKEGTEREAALAAVPFNTPKDACSAIEAIFHDSIARPSRWDGSIA